MTSCYLSLGSNLRSPKRQLNRAQKALRNLPRSTIVKQSRIYATTPWGVKAQPTYSNQVILIKTTLPAQRLLYLCQKIEHQQQRIRKRRWAARTLDIDLLLYGNKVINTHSLTIPHPRMLLRDFVLIPLLELDPNARMPDGKLISHVTGL